MTEIELQRMNHLIDPRLQIWGWEIPVYLFLGGMAAGIMILGGLLKPREGEPSRAARLLPFAAPILLSLGMLALFLDLELKRHVFRFYLAFRPSSPMSWGSWILLAVYPASLALGLLGLTEAETARATNLGPLRLLGGLIRRGRTLALRHAAAVRYANIALGLGLGVYTGILLGSLGARAAWSSSMLGPLFLVSGISTGAALMMLFPLSHQEHRRVLRFDLLAVGLELVLIALFLLGLATGSEASQRAASLFLGGPYTALFFALVVIAGLLAPLLIEAVEALRGLRPTRIAPLLLILGGLSLRFIVVAAGQA